MSTNETTAKNDMMQHHRITKAVIPAAGMGTRFLPVTKSIPKEMLPIIDKPVLQFVVEEAIASGIKDILIITGRGKQAIENHFDFNPELEYFLERSGKETLIEHVRALAEKCQFFYVRQNEPLGLGDAIKHAQPHVGNEPFAVLLGDTIIEPHVNNPPGLQQLIDIYQQKQASVVSVHRVPDDWIQRYGIVEGKAESEVSPDLLRLHRLIEKPQPPATSSNLAIAGRYILTPAIFDCLARVESGFGNELQLTDAMNLLVQKEAVYAFAWQAKRYDIGDSVEYTKCFIEYALRRPETAQIVREHMQQLLNESPEVV